MTEVTTTPGVGQISATDVLHSSRLGAVRVGFMVVAFLCVLLDGIDIGVWGFVYPHLVADWSAPVSAITTIATVGYVALAVGALVAGPIADRVGRKPTLVVGILLFAVPLIVAAFSRDLVTMGVCRAIACAGLGAVMPLAIALVSEYLPAKRKALLVTIVFAGFPLGQSVVGYLAAWIVPTAGWERLLLVGGVAGLVLALLVLFVLPESIALMVRTDRGAVRAQAVMTRIARSVGDERQVVVLAPESGAQSRPTQNGVRTVLTPPTLWTSIVVWFAYLANCTVTYVIVGYLPLILAQMNMDATNSGPIVGMAGWGGVVGSLAIGYAMSRFGRYKAIIIGLTLTAISVSAVAIGDWNLTGLLVLGFLWGLFNGGSNGGMNAFAAEAFPAVARGTGLAWMHSAGKMGAILSGLLGGLMISAGWGLGAIFVAFAAPVMIAAIGFLALAAAARRTERTVLS